ncbi:MAG TPA: ABC transporter substrate-binding protein [Cyclobacteriaceae bacterium]
MIFFSKDNEAVLHIEHRRFFIVRFVSFIFLVFIHLSCSRPPEQKTETQALNVSFAKGFSIQREGNNTLVTVNYPYQGATSGYKYLLVHRGQEVPEHPADVQVIEVPVETIVCTSTTHIPHLDYLGVTDKLVGFPSTDYISSETARKRIDAGLVKDLGIDNAMNLELLYTLKPSLVMAYTTTADLGQLKKVQELGIPVVLNGEYLERDPLGRAEWIKFTSLLFGKDKVADSVFNVIAQEYMTTQTMADNGSSSDDGTLNRPTVLLGTVYGDAWFMPGGQNYASKLLQDASNTYLWASDTTHGWLEISFESVYSRAKDADLWIVGSFDTYEQLKAADQRYSLFKPFMTKHMYNYNARKGAKGGNDFLELGYLRPDLVLKDLVKIGHPDLLPDHKLYFHAPLR